MSTPNFALKNASRYFVFGVPVFYTQEEIDERELDQDLLGEFDELGTDFNYDADKGNVAYELKAKGWHDIEECDGDRSYPTSLFSEKTVSIKCGDNSLDITCDYDYNDLTADDVINDDWYENKGLSKIHAAHIFRKIESIIDDLKNEAECAFSKYCDEEMFCAWQSFNGEAGYSAAGKRLWQEVEELNKKTA